MCNLICGLWQLPICRYLHARYVRYTDKTFTVRFSWAHLTTSCSMIWLFINIPTPISRRNHNIFGKLCQLRLIRKFSWPRSEFCFKMPSPVQRLVSIIQSMACAKIMDIPWIASVSIIFGCVPKIVFLQTPYTIPAEEEHLNIVGKLPWPLSLLDLFK